MLVPITLVSGRPIFYRSSKQFVGRSLFATDAHSMIGSARGLVVIVAFIWDNKCPADPGES